MVRHSKSFASHSSKQGLHNATSLVLAQADRLLTTCQCFAQQKGRSFVCFPCMQSYLCNFVHHVLRSEYHFNWVQESLPKLCCQLTRHDSSCQAQPHKEVEILGVTYTFDSRRLFETAVACESIMAFKFQGQTNRSSRAMA